MFVAFILESHQAKRNLVTVIFTQYRTIRIQCPMVLWESHLGKPKPNNNEQTNQLKCGSMCRMTEAVDAHLQTQASPEMSRKVHQVLSAHQHSSNTCYVYDVWGWEQTSIIDSLISLLQTVLKQGQCLSLFIPFTIASIILKSTKVKSS